MRRWVAAIGMLAAVTGCSPAGSTNTDDPAATALPPLAPPTPGTPIARGDAAMAYDPDTGQTVLFGGLAANGDVGDTWVWDGSRWLQQHPALSPHSRDSAAMVYDPALHAVVLIGGGANAPIEARERADMAATWLWTGSGWLRRDTAHSPNSSGQPPFSTGSGPIAYDTASRRIVMVVGHGGLHLLPCSAATWTFDGTDWHQEALAAPLPATVAAIVPEPPGGHVLAVLAPRAALAPVGFSGPDCPAGSPEARALPASTTWRWSGSAWSQVASGTEPPTTSQLEAVAGASEVIRSTDESVWGWSGSGWRMATVSGQAPPRRTSAQASLDQDGHVVLFGGFPGGPGEAFDTWTWNGSAWTNRTGPAPATPTPSPSFFTPPPG